MKELLIKSERFPSLYVQLLDGKVAMIDDSEENKAFSDNEVYIYEMYKVLEAARKKGGFDHLEDIEKVDVETLFV